MLKPRLQRGEDEFAGGGHEEALATLLELAVPMGARRLDSARALPARWERCSDRWVMHRSTPFGFLIVLVLAPFLLFGPVRAAYFDDGNDRQSVIDLRRLVAENESLTLLEQAILRAANRTGKIAWLECQSEAGNPISGNAFLVGWEGRDYILASGHLVIDLNVGGTKGDCSFDDFTHAVYMPNSSYFDPQNPPPNDSIVFERINVVKSNLDSIDSQTFRLENFHDWMLFELPVDRELSSDLAIDGSVRGRFDFPTSIVREGDTGVIIGSDSRQPSGLTTYQVCSFSEVDAIVYHSCDTAVGSSSSFFGSYERGEIQLRGIHNRTSQQYLWGGETYPLPENRTDWNRALSAAAILHQIEERMNRRFPVEPDENLEPSSIDL